MPKPDHDMMMGMIRKHFGENVQAVLTFTRMKDGIDVDFPCYAIEAFYEDAVAAERERLAKIFDDRAAEHEKAWNNCSSDGHRNASHWRDRMYDARSTASTIRGKS